jgi:hypothetical protein
MVVRFGSKKVYTITAGQKEAENTEISLMNIFSKQFAQRVVIRDPSMNEPVMSRLPLDLTEFEWADPIARDTIYQFERNLFYRGLLILPIYGYGTMEEIPLPTVDDLILFAESNIDTICINRLLSQLLWQPGDTVCRGNERYEVVDIQVGHGSVSVREAQYLSSPVDHPTLQLPINEL